MMSDLRASQMIRLISKPKDVDGLEAWLLLHSDTTWITYLHLDS